jgi:hypothetical protein
MNKGAMKAWFEDLPLDFTRDKTRTAERLLIAGFTTNIAALTLAENAGLDLSLLNQMAPVKFLMREILVKARQSDRLIQLLAEVLRDPSQEAVHQELQSLVAGYEGVIAVAAMRRKPSLSTLALLPSTIEVWSPGDAAAQPLATPGLEKLINAAAGFADPAMFRLRLAEAEVRTARIDIGGKAVGTGFLVASSLLLTNWHVVKDSVEGAVAIFDNKVTAEGGEQDKGRAVPFASSWLVAHSPHEAVSVEIGPNGPPIGNWDFALVRLAEPVGLQAIGPDPKATDASKRGQYTLDGSPYHFEEAEPMLILGHPTGRPVQFSYASPSHVRSTKDLSRVRYQTNTEAGSSGSPVFNRDWRVVALHHAAGPTSVPGDFNLLSGEFNQGIPISGIVNQLKKQLARRPELAELGLV